MLPYDIDEDGGAAARPKKTATPHRSPAIRRPANATPTKKVAVNKTGTPNSAPAKLKPSAKKPEPTVFADFLLGRPSMNRTRSKTIDAMPMEIKRSAVDRIQPPGGVKERVKKWQKASAVAGVEGFLEPPSEPDDISLRLDDRSVTEEDRRRIKFRKNHAQKPGRRKSQDNYNPITPVKSISSPRKRVVSDDHWVNDKGKNKPKRTPKALSGNVPESQSLPKDFLKNSANPTLEKKIEDWNKRTIGVERAHNDNQEGKRSSSAAREGDQILSSSRSRSPKTRIRVKPFNGKPHKVSEVEERVESHERQNEKPHDADYKGNKRKIQNQKQSVPSREEMRNDAENNPVIPTHEEEPKVPYRTPTQLPRTKNRQTHSPSPESLADIPVGYSAFSVLDFSEGGNATTTRPPKPQRQASLSAVPKALKKVYTEGIRKMQDAVDPPRTGVNQPPSIESWLKGTSDPFIDDVSNSDNVCGISKPKSRQRSYSGQTPPYTDNADEIERYDNSVRQQRKHGSLNPQHGNETASLAQTGGETPMSNALPIQVNIIEEESQPHTPIGLARRPAARQASPPKLVKHTTPKDVAIDSCSGLTQSDQKSGIPNLYAKGLESRPGSDSDRQDHFFDVKTKEFPSSQSLPSAGASLLKPKDVSGFNAREYSIDRDHVPSRQRRLSTIPSIETLQTSSMTEISSKPSDTTVAKSVTQNISQSSATSNTSYSNVKVTDEIGTGKRLKRRLTKHSDLLSVLSIPENTLPGRTKSIRSARSIRTARIPLDAATLKDLLRELADDEVKYMRELKALVDGVIPVLLSYVVSKNDTAIASSIFGQNSNGNRDASTTKSIVDMGIALERLRSLHRRIPFHDSELLLLWATDAHKVYDDYVDAWRIGFQNLIINLAPSSQSDLAGEQSLDDMPRNGDGDVLNESGERVDVAFLLKRPLVRIKYLARVMKGVYSIRPRDQAAKVSDIYQELLTKVRRRTGEEAARLEDQAACTTDISRTRNPRTLAPLENVTIDTTRQVYAKDFFDFGLSHSSGQRIDCRVELLFRDKPQDKSDVGDVLICEVDSISRWLLFPPIERNRISAQAGDVPCHLVVTIIGTEGSMSWHEVFTLKSADEETAVEWMQMLGLSSRPPSLLQVDTAPAPILSQMSPVKSAEHFKNEPSSLRSTNLDPAELDVPIGERPTKAVRFLQSKANNEEWRKLSADNHSMSAQYKNRISGKDDEVSRDKPLDLNDAMDRAGKMASFDLRQKKAQRHTSYNIPRSPVKLPLEGLPKTKDFEQDSKPAPFLSYNSDASRQNDLGATSSDLCSSKTLSVEISPISRNRKFSYTSTQEDTNLPFETRSDDQSHAQQTCMPTANGFKEKEEAPPPPPPAHRILDSSLPKRPPDLAKPTSKTRNRRTSSPLKHEYQPSGPSDESDPEELVDSSDSSEEELEAADVPVATPDPARLRKKVSPAGSFYSLPTASLAPSNSASQILSDEYRLESNIKTTRARATVSCWSDKGRWVDLHPQDCSVIVGPGMIEAYVPSEIDGAESAFSSNSSSYVNTDVEARSMRPLVCLELTPIVPLRQSNAIDIEIRSPPTAKSAVECTHTVRFRSRTVHQCSALYAAIHRARMENPIYLKLEQERIVSAYGKQLLEENEGSNRRRSWFGRSKSYRASTRAPSDIISENSTNSIASAISRLRNIGVFGAFNIDQSSVGRSQGGLSGSSGATSVYTGSTNSASSRNTPPRTPSDPSTAMTGGPHAASFGSSDLRIRLYLNVTPSKWRDFGTAFLTVTHPTHGMRQASSLYHGIEKRVIVTKKQSTKRTLSEKIQGSGGHKTEESGASEVILDVILGGACFSRQGVVGIAMNVWEDIKGDDGEVGKVAAIGGVSGRTRRWMFHFASAAETAWAFSLVGGGVR